MCEWFDETCGQLLDHLDTKGVSENTIVLYICDNGWAAASTNADDPHQKLWKGFAQRSKGSPFENGIRTPIMVSWPQHIKPEKRTELAHAIDLYPTIAAAAGFDPPANLPGVNLLNAKTRVQRKRVFGVTHSIHNMTVGDPNDTLQYLWCVERDWKLLLRHHGIDTTDYRNLHVWDDVPVRLYNLATDPHEENNLADLHPDIVMRLTAEIETWHRSGSDQP